MEGSRVAASSRDGSGRFRLEMATGTLWVAQCLADMVIDADTRPELPFTAWHSLVEGFSDAGLATFWQQRVRPVLIEWLADPPTAIDPAELRVALTQGGRESAAPTRKKHPVLDPCFEVVMGYRALLCGYPDGEWAAVARVLHDMTEVVLAVPGGCQRVGHEHLSSEQLSALADGQLKAVRPLLSPAERSVAEQRLRAALGPGSGQA